MKPYVVYSTNELLSATYMDVLPAFQESNVIYQFSCHCDSRYVGRISLRLQDRIKKHVPKSIRSSSSSQKRLLPACHCKSSIQSLASDSAIELIFYKILTVLSIMIRVIIFFRQSTGTVVVLRDFSGDLQKKKSSLRRPMCFCNFQVSSQTNKKPGHGPKAAKKNSCTA